MFACKIFVDLKCFLKSLKRSFAEKKKILKTFDSNDLSQKMRTLTSLKSLNFNNCTSKIHVSYKIY